ncbi:TonB C-terminal domain-containing protein [bacterium]|nr:TonB C-terminal domain-containing protein [bacterium]
MYKCSECGAEYEVKPEYCDCGNDTFEEIAPAPSVQTINKDEKFIVNTPQKKLEREIPKFSPKPAPKQQSYNYEKIKNFFDPISTILFLCCIGFAIYITLIGYDFNKPVETVEKEQVQEAATPQNIPSVDAFWDNTPVSPKVVPVKRVEAAQESRIAQVVEQVFKPQKVQTPPPAKPQVTQPKASSVQAKPKSSQKTVQTKPASATSVTTGAKSVDKKTASKVQTQNQNKAATQVSSQSTQKAASSAQKTSSQSSATQNSHGIDLAKIVSNNKNYSNNTQYPTTSNTASVAKSSSTSQTQKTQPASSSAVQSSQTKSSSPTVTTQTSKPAAQTQSSKPVVAKTEPKPVDPAVLKQELANYKISLRNTIGKKIDFARVVGDGECALSFSLDSSGRLLNRKFTKQSSNVTLNDAVFSAVNSTTRYNPPPAGYKNETLNLNIRFYNGNFSISLN